MFDELGEKLNAIIKKLSGRGTLSESNIEEALREVRLSLLSADVNFKVVRDFTESVKARALGSKVLESLTPGQQFVKLIHEELVRIMGGGFQELNLRSAQPAPVMLVGLQGSGKTTTAAKLGRMLKEEGRKVYLVAADVYRPAAITQLQVLGEQLGLAVHPSSAASTPEVICAEAKEAAYRQGYDVMLVDTAGRLHIDDEMMQELKRLKEILKPAEILLVADAMTGQDAVRIADSFNKTVGITGAILTKIDGDARGGAALSIVSVTQKPIKFAGTGEKLDALEPFHPDRIASRILGMGDVLTFVERAQKVYDEKQAEELSKKISKGEFTLDDFLGAIRQMKKMGSMEELLSMLPGVGGQMKEMAAMAPPEQEIKKVEAIINSMSKKERVNFKILNGSRRLRIAAGSGTTIQDVNRFIKQYMQARKMMKRFKGLKGLAGMMRGL